MAYRPDRQIVVIGEMGVGKTTVGEALAERLGTVFLDSDRVLEASEGRSGAAIAAGDGVQVLHRAELQAFRTMLASDAGGVMAPAASVVDTESGRSLFGEALVVWLTAPDDVLAERQAADDHRRPVTAEERGALRKRRRPHLEALADMTIDTGEIAPTAVVDRVIAAVIEDHAQRSR